MQVNHILNSSRPDKLISCTGVSNNSTSKKVRYKHYYEMEDNDLKSYSIAKAFNTVQNSGKARLKRSIPAITSVAIATSLAIAQPGKISTRMKSGLGFLATVSIISGVLKYVPRLMDNYFSNKMLKTGAEIPKEKRDLAEFGVTMATGLGIFGISSLLSSKKGVFKANNLTKFITKEGAALSKELQETKLGKFVENRLNPFVTKNQKAFNVGAILSAIGISAVSGAANARLTKSISRDFNELAKSNYIKGKAAQADARAHFESIDAIEI